MNAPDSDNARKGPFDVDLLLSVLQSIEDAVTAVDIDGRYCYWNLAAERLYGYTANEVIGHNASEFHAGPWETELAPSIAIFGSGETVAAIERRRLHKSGQEIEVSVRFSPIRSPSGELVGISTVARNISDQRRIEKERTELAERLIEIETTISRNIAEDIHDGPLQQLIAASLRLGLVKRALESHSAGNIASIERAITQSIAQLRNIMFDAAPAVINSGGLIVALQEYLARFEDLKDGIAVTFDAEGDTDLLEHDATALYRVGREAIMNSLKHAEPSHISVRLTNQENGLSLIVEDDGRGMGVIASPAGHRGLSQMHTLIEHLSGTLDVTSSLGQGTVVRAWIPKLE